jgi:hypothetical protein
MTCASARPPLIGTSCAIRQGDERGRLAPHGTPRGIRRPGACSQGCSPASWPATGRRGLVSRRLPRGVATRCGVLSDGAGRPRRAWAAPPPRPTRTGACKTRRPPDAEDGRRAQTYGAVAEQHPKGARHAPCRWRLHLQTCGVPPCAADTCPRQCSPDTRPTADGAGPSTAEITANPPLSGAVCRLTPGALIRVRPCTSLQTLE